MSIIIIVVSVHCTVRDQVSVWKFLTSKLSSVLIYTKLFFHSVTAPHIHLSPTPSLPDVVPQPRDRSLSMPDVKECLRRRSEQFVGRRLRRISDEFHEV